MKKNKIIIIMIILSLFSISCLCPAAIMDYLSGFTDNILGQIELDDTAEQTPTSPAWPTTVPEAGEPDNNYEAPVGIIQDPANQSLETLIQEIVPINDPIDLAERLGGKSDIPDTYPDINQPYKVGDSKNFWVSNTDTNENFQVETTLQYVGDHIYFWIEEGVKYSPTDLNNLADAFDKEIYPTNREFFGSEWNPGIDNDPRIYIVYAGGLGFSLAGYYSSADELHPAAHLYSNAHEMFLMNSDTVDLGDDYIYGTMAHEFQHMIHWYNDRNEETWLNEGFSMLAELINEYDTGGFDYLYLLDTDIQLTDWNGSTGDNGSHYGASFLFTTYFLDRFGEKATKALVSHAENGMASLEQVAEELNLINPDTNKPYTSDEFFADWAVTNFVSDRNIDNGRYDYISFSPFDADITESISSCPINRIRDVYQFGVNYLEIDCPGEHLISFHGTSQVSILPIDNDPSGNYFFWSNMGDESNSRFTAAFDLTKVSSPVTLDYKMWHDLEKDYDYVFLSASTDGKVWEIINTPTCTAENPSGNSYGCGYNGQTGGWIDESVDLSRFAGQEVTLRFDYVTDAAVNGNGFAIDDMRIDAIGYNTDFEKDDGGWDGEGFVRIQNILPQTFNLSLIEFGSKTSVTHIPLDGDNKAYIQVNISGDVDRAVLVISGTTILTREKAIYEIDIK